MSRARDLADSADLNFDDGTLVIDSGNNRVGIGTASPDTALHVYDSSQNGVALFESGDSDTYISLKDSNTSGQWYYNRIGVAGDDLYFYTYNSEAARIDSSGNLHIGKTATNFAVTGATLKNEGSVQFTRDGGQVALFNRLTSDGTILDLRKDGTTVGSIGARSGELTIGNASTALLFDDDASYIIPWNLSTDSGGDNTIDLGNSNQRFKDLYLSGGVYLGGTGAANYLDDYEEGTFTVALESDTGTNPVLTIGEGSYVKIGSLVYVFGRLRVDPTNGMSGTTSTAFNIITGLPFTVSDTLTSTGVEHYCNCQWDGFATALYSLHGHPTENTNYIDLFRLEASNVNSRGQRLLNSVLANGASIRFFSVYHTDQ